MMNTEAEVLARRKRISEEIRAARTENTDHMSKIQGLRLENWIERR